MVSYFRSKSCRVSVFHLLFSEIKFIVPIWNIMRASVWVRLLDEDFNFFSPSRTQHKNLIGIRFILIIHIHFELLLLLLHPIQIGLIVINARSIYYKNWKSSTPSFQRECMVFNGYVLPNLHCYDRIDDNKVTQCDQKPFNSKLDLNEYSAQCPSRANVLDN